ncbi:MAG TPA: hypothetical protein IAC25_03725 [Candidatus Enterenecus stercoripullorum]|nr:hypothetical protein [Candidatus Enterenecus stercoripullorum]
MPPEILQKILGHADYSTTVNVYNHIDTIVKSIETVDVTSEQTIGRIRRKRKALEPL